MSAADLTVSDASVMLGVARHALAMEAAMEVEALCLAMRDALDPACEVDSRALRGFRCRILELSRAAMSALCDEREETRTIARRVGIPLPLQEGEA